MDFFTEQTYEKLFKGIPEDVFYTKGDMINGKYLVKSILSGGKNSDVYKAVDILRDNFVVIKYVKGNCFSEKTTEYQKNAIKELKKWSGIPLHRNILPVYDGFYDTRIQKFAIVSPYVKATHPKGLTLADLIKNGYKFSLNDVSYLFKEIYKAIADIKNKTGQLYIHKDIRPENIFINAPEKTENFRQCRIILADCGSYSSFAGALPADYNNFRESAIDAFMLVSTGKEMCLQFSKGKGKLALFCKNLHKESTILDFRDFFGDVKESEKCAAADVLDELITAYNAFTFSPANIDKDREFTVRFNNLCNEYINAYKDPVLPMFLILKDSQYCDRHEDALKRMEFLSEHTDKWDSSPARFFSEYSKSFSAEMLIRLAISVYNQTDIFKAETDERRKLCSLFEQIDLTQCFDLSFLSDAAELCEFMLIYENDENLLNALALKTSQLVNINDKPAKQLEQDRRLWSNVFNCIKSKDNCEKSKLARDTAKLAMLEPYNVSYLFYSAKLLMLSSEITASKAFSFLTTDIIESIKLHTIQTSATKTLLLYQVLAAYWTCSFELSEYYCLQAIKNLSPISGKSADSSCTIAKFKKLKAHIEKEIRVISEKHDEEHCLNDKSKLCYNEKYRLYNIASKLRYTESLCDALTDEISKPGNKDMEKIAKLIDILRKEDMNSPLSSRYGAYFFAMLGNFDRAERLIKDYSVKMRFSYPENPFSKQDERNIRLKDFYDALNTEVSEFTANMLNITIYRVNENKNCEENNDNYEETNTVYY